jgi:hypothetical protein
MKTLCAVLLLALLVIGLDCGPHHSKTFPPKSCETCHGGK